MKIQQASAYANVSLSADSSSQRQNIASQAANSVAPSSEAYDSATISQAAREHLALEEGSGDVYDFRNISPDDVLGTVNSLIKSGKMSLDESTALMAFVPRDGLSIGKLGVSDAAQSIDLFSGLERMMTYYKSLDDDAAVAYQKKALSALTRIDTENSQSFEK